jgi:serine/threonine protein kinase
MTSLPRFEPGAVFAGDFVVERRLAEGGMGAVYVVEQRSTGHRRALKVMHPDIVADARNRERFTQEARVGALIQSPYVVEVAAAGVDDATGTPWLLMELLEGESLRERIVRGALPDRAMLREMFEQLGDALGRAHAAGVVHRDLKPENLFIAVSRLRGVPFLMKVLDFGIAAIVSERKDSATVTTVIGSPMWMAPEQASVGARVGAPADVWALGLITFYALTGRYFWPSLTGVQANINIAALLVDVVVNAIPAPSARAATLDAGDRLPAGFDAWFARCVVRDPAARFPNARAAIDALLPLLADGHPTAVTPTPSAPSLLAASPLFATASSPPPAVDAPLAPDTLVTAAPVLTDAPVAPTAPSRKGGLVALLVVVALLGAVVATLVLRSARPTATPTDGGHDAVVRTTDVAAVATADVAVLEAAADVPTREEAPDVTVDAVAPEGQLDVQCSRRCRVTVDGVDRGSPRRPIALAAGEHTVVASVVGASLTRVVRVETGETARVVFAFGDAATPAAPPARDAAAVVVPPARDAAAVVTADAGLPDRPARAAIEAAFREVTTAARACGVSGRVFVLANFAGDGHVLSASAEREHANTPAGECLARAVRQVRLPPFRRTSIRVSQPLDL